jgi:membrane fusion protein (multidrug efflux system)
MNLEQDQKANHTARPSQQTMNTPPPAATSDASATLVVETLPMKAAPNPEPPAASVTSRRRSAVRWIGLSIGALVLLWWIWPWIVTSLNTVSTDDAYVDGHVTFLAARVSGQVKRVLVDDNMRVKAGDILVEIDPEPLQVQLNIQQALVGVAEANLVAAHSQIEGLIGQARGARFTLEHAIETVRNQMAALRSNVAQLNVEKASLVLAQQDYDRYKKLVQEKVITQSEFEGYTAKFETAKSRVDSAEQVVQQTRVGLGLAINKEEPLNVPDDLEQNFSLVRQSLAQVMQYASQLGYRPSSWQMNPRDSIAEFYQQDATGNLDTIYAQLIPNAPIVKQAQANLEQARRDLDLAKLNLRYCKVVSEIDGVVTRRNVNPGNNVQVGQSLMAVRSLTDIWVNANFKETQLADLRIGQRVRLEVDMYGRRKEFSGKISGFTMGTGQTLALLPPQNATGNFIKIVQRLPVRIELTDYDPEQNPLFVGLSVVPYVYFKEPATGPRAGSMLQLPAELPHSEVEAEQKSDSEAKVKAPTVDSPPIGN